MFKTSCSGEETEMTGTSTITKKDKTSGNFAALTATAEITKAIAEFGTIQCSRLILSTLTPGDYKIEWAWKDGETDIAADATNKFT
jgi:hypothetical protein